jgi:chemotaxis protein histidine kinase CheA
MKRVRRHLRRLQKSSRRLSHNRKRKKSLKLKKNKVGKLIFVLTLSLLKTGNDPVRMFRELNELGQLSINVNIQDVPNLDELDPEECNISWELKLVTETDEKSIREIFSWVEDDAAIEIAPLAKPKKPKKVKPAPVASANAEASVPPPKLSLKKT